MTGDQASNDARLSPEARLKKAAAEAAVGEVRSGMILGLGTGSTARWVVIGIGERLARGELTDVAGVPTSEATRALAETSGVPLVELPPTGVDLAIDGMDEVDPHLDAIKGLGGALLREKIVAASASSFVLIGDPSKPVERLGERAPVPVEVLPFGVERTIAHLARLDVQAELRRDDAGRPVESDNDHWLVDCRFDPSRDARELGEQIAAIPGVLEHGFFFDLARVVYIATPDGVQTMTRDATP